MKLFTLIHIEENEKSLHNNSYVKGFKAQINLYLSCAIQLHHSLRKEGIEVAIITNNKSFIERLNRRNYQIEIIELNFELKVPSGIKFYSAHFKLELFNYLSSLDDNYVGIVDSDVICVNPIPSSLKQLIEHQVPLYYDITEHRAYAYGIDRLIEDKEKVSCIKSCGLWAGGEFITGSPIFFGRLYTEISRLQESYFKHFSILHHQGDEMITSIAIENMIMHQHETIINAGSLLIIGRYWSPKTLHIQNSIDAFSKHFLLHFPADKKFLANLELEELQGAAFFKKYKKYLAMNSYKKYLGFLKPYLRR